MTLNCIILSYTDRDYDKAISGYHSCHSTAAWLRQGSAKVWGNLQMHLETCAQPLHLQYTSKK